MRLTGLSFLPGGVGNVLAGKHIDRAKELLRQVACGQIDEHYLKTLETADTFLREGMDFRVFSRG